MVELRLIGVSATAGVGVFLDMHGFKVVAIGLRGGGGQRRRAPHESELAVRIGARRGDVLPDHQHHVIGRVVDGDREAEPRIDPGARRAGRDRRVGVEHGVDEDIVRHPRHRHRAAVEIRRIQVRQVGAVEVVEDRGGQRPVDLAVRADQRDVAAPELRPARDIERVGRGVRNRDGGRVDEPPGGLRDERAPQAADQAGDRGDQCTARDTSCWHRVFLLSSPRTLRPRP